MAAINTWDAFGEAIKLQFRPVNLLKKARDELNNLPQRDRQSVQDFVTNVRRICLLLPTVTEEEKKHRFLFGLADRRIRTEINLTGGGPSKAAPPIEHRRRPPSMP